MFSEKLLVEYLRSEKDRNETHIKYLKTMSVYTSDLNKKVGESEARVNLLNHILDKLSGTTFHE